MRYWIKPPNGAWREITEYSYTWLLTCLAAEVDQPDLEEGTLLCRSPDSWRPPSPEWQPRPRSKGVISELLDQYKGVQAA